MAQQQRLVPEDFQTRKPATPLYCHQDFLEKLQDNPAGKRAALLLQRLAVDPRRQHYKATMGANRGWRRSRLGGNHGSHFYAWWAPKGAAPLKNLAGFDDAPEGSIFLREIRHHDDHTELTAQSLSEHYLPVSVEELRREEYGPTPWTPAQARFAKAKNPVAILKGHPGSGKTTALWHAVDLAGAESVLYVTYSRDLAALAQDYFDRYCPAFKKFRVVTVPALMRDLAGSTLEIAPESERRARFIRELGTNTRLGPWANHRGSLYEELHAHLIGEALPEKAGRFEACSAPRVKESTYRERRTRFIGTAAAASAAEIVHWLTRNRPNFEPTLFPELFLAWTAALKLRQAPDLSALRARGLLDFDVLAVDEVQDLTPIETYALIQLAKAAGQRRGRPAAVMMAGDEAQTVRPTDFEWAWLNDLLHDQLGTPVEHKLTVNLRSPRRIAELVNRVWDLYSHLSKQDRPSGVGVADIEEDSADQIIYCAATPGTELSDLCQTLAGREGLALISLETLNAAQPLPDYIPELVRPNILTAAEAKGLDFQSVAVIGAGRKLRQITTANDFGRGDGGIEALGRRLAIDELRVVLSRPTERLYWIDVDPSKEIVAESLRFLNGNIEDRQVSASVPAGVLRTLEEDQLDIEERIQRCQSDARQYLSVKPGMAWTRAQQAVTLLGTPGVPGAVEDEQARRASFLTAAEIAFTLAIRKVALPNELGRPDLLEEAARSALRAHRYGLANVIREIARQPHAPPAGRLEAMANVVRRMVDNSDELEPWLLLEIQPRAKSWLDELELAAGSGTNARILLRLLPPFYKVLNLADSDARLKRLQQRSLTSLLKEKAYADALELLRDLPDPRPRDEAACHEGLGDFRGAAQAWLAAGDRKEALQCFRKIPDFEQTLALLNEIGDHPAADSLRWVREMQQLASRRPPEFTKVMMPSEKKMLEAILEQSLGISRKKPAARKAAATKKPAVKRSPR
jgi:tetratricopeptide (TPR) repeat protein